GRGAEENNGGDGSEESRGAEPSTEYWEAEDHGEHHAGAEEGEESAVPAEGVPALGARRSALGARHHHRCRERGPPGEDGDPPALDGAHPPGAREGALEDDASRGLLPDVLQQHDGGEGRHRHGVGAREPAADQAARSPFRLKRRLIPAPMAMTPAAITF